MSFPAQTFDNPTTAQMALANFCELNGLSAIVLDGQQAVQDAVLMNLVQELPAATVVGGTAVANGAGALGTGGFVSTSVVREGALRVTRILVDLTGLESSTTDLDIIGQGTSAAYLTQITAAVNGTIVGGTMTCLEVPAGGVTDIDLYVATAGTGKFDDAVTGLAGQAAVVTSGGAWTLAAVKGTAPDAVVANGYLYLAGGAAGTAAPYTAGRILITLFGR
jgi:hypothetical protein